MLPSDSSRRPVIGLSGRRRYGRDLVGSPPNLADQPADVYMSHYARAVHEAGGVPVHIPFGLGDPREFAADMIAIVDGLLIPGGADISPGLYGADPDPDLEAVEPERDRQETALFDAAAAVGMPVLGICRGIQMMNVHAGGTLVQHVPTHARFDGQPGTPVHKVEFAPDSTAARLFGTVREVNSLHHQAIAEVAPGFKPTGFAQDGTIEAIEHETLPWFGVQWHPEMMDCRSQDPVFSWLVDVTIGLRNQRLATHQE